MVKNAAKLKEYFDEENLLPEHGGISDYVYSYSLDPDIEDIRDEEEEAAQMRNVQEETEKEKEKERGSRRKEQDRERKEREKQRHLEKERELAEQIRLQEEEMNREVSSIMERYKLRRKEMEEQRRGSQGDLSLCIPGKCLATGSPPANLIMNAHTRHNSAPPSSTLLESSSPVMGSSPLQASLLAHNITNIFLSNDNQTESGAD